MKQHYLVFLLVLVTMAVACNGETQSTPTPFPEEGATEEALEGIEPLAISITDLAADPEAYSDNFVEVTGQYRRRPWLVCNTEPYPSPATWQLEAEDGSLIAIGGFDTQVRSLLPNNLTVTVVGVWQMYAGPIGCGKSATATQIWYLKARDIVSPSPIARVTLTPTGSGTLIADVDGETAVPNPTNEAGNTPLTPTLADDGDSGNEPTNTPDGGSLTTPTPDLTPTRSEEDEQITPSPTRSEEDEERTATPTTSGVASPTPTVGTGTPTPTGSSGGSGTATPTMAAITTATRNPGDFDTVEFDDLGPEQPVLELLEMEQAHLYPIIFDYNGAITITAIAEPTMNLVLEIIDNTNDVVQQANQGGNGEREAIVNAQLNVALDYKIRIYNLNANSGDYCLLFSEGGGFPDVIKGRIQYGQTVNDRIEVLGIDYWCFLGANGDNISISSSPSGTAGDFVVALFGPPDFDSIGSVFQDPDINNISLSESGMFVIGILDFEAGAAGYSLTLTKN